MVNIPDGRRALGRTQVDGADRPAEINPNVAYDIGRAGAYWDKAMGDVSKGFAKLAMSKKKVDDDTWLAERKIETLKNDDALRRKTDLEAGNDGSGYETVPEDFTKIVQDQEAVPGGSAEARQSYKLWSAERGYDTGKWAINSSQGRLKQSTLQRLDDRLGEMTNMATANPDMALQYFQAYEDEVRGQVGNSIPATEGKLRIEKARGDILKAGVLSKTKRAPMDYAKAIKALDDAGKVAGKDQSRLSQDRGVSRDDAVGRAARAEGVSEQTMRTFSRIESSDDPSNTTGQYSGRFQLSDSEFAKYGGAPGKILDDDENSKAYARKLKAETAQFKKDHGREPSDLDLYIVHQQGRGGHAAHFKNPERPAWQNMASTTEGRKRGAAWAKDAIWGNMTPEMKSHFPGGVEDVTSRQFIGLWHMRLERVGGEVARPPSQAIADGIRLKDLPTVEGSIQPAELMSLRPEDYRAITSELKPYIATEMQGKVQDAVAATLASGAQAIVTKDDLELMPIIVGPRVAQQWKEAIEEAQDLHNINYSAKNMSGAERRQHIAAIRPDTNAGEQSAEERKHFERWVKVDSEINKQMKENPIAWFSSQNEAGRAAMSRIATAAPEDVKAREQAFDTLLQLQRNEGLDSKDITLMSKDEAEKVVNGLMNAKTGAEVTQVLDGMRQTYGKHFNMVWGQLARQGGPNAFRAMPTTSFKGQNAMIETYLLEKSLGDAAGKDGNKSQLLRARAGVSGRDLKDFDTAINEEVSELNNALDPSAFGLKEAYRDAVERVALYYMIQDGKSNTDAVKKAAEDVYRNTISIVDTVAVPHTVMGDNAEARWEMRNGIRNAGKLVRQMGDQIIAKVPASRFGQTYNHQRYVERVIYDNRLVTSNDGQGVNLLDMAGGRVMIDTPDGPSPLFISWEQLRAVSRTTALGRRDRYN